MPSNHFFKTKLATVVGLLVLLGAGCAKTGAIEQAKQSAAALAAVSSTKTADTSGKSADVKGLCYSTSPLPASFPETGILDTMGHFRPASDSGPYDNEAEALLPKLHDLYSAGWNVDKFCVTEVGGVRVAYFTLYAFYGDALKTKPVQSVGATGETNFTLVKFGYEKDGVLVLSDPFGVGRSNKAINLTDYLNLSPAGDDISTKASDYAWSYSIKFAPATKELDIIKS